MPNNQSVTPQYLLQGACYALEQCGILLDAATTLFEAESYATSIVLAAFAREELGHALILRDLRKDVIAGGTVTISKITDQCADHSKKQDAALLSISYGGSNDSWTSPASWACGP